MHERTLSPRARSTVSVAAPFVTAVVTWAGPRVLGALYRAGTGRRAPTITSTRYSTLSKVVWSMAVAGVVALAEAVILNAIRDLDAESLAQEAQVTPEPGP